MTDEDYTSFTDPSNYGAQVLLAHFLVLNHMLEECFHGATSRRFSFSKRITQSWILNIGRRLPDGFQRYMMWPLGQARDLTV
jgi:ABC-type arginine transport system ATPase subunit